MGFSVTLMILRIVVLVVLTGQSISYSSTTVDSGTSGTNRSVHQLLY